MCNRPPDRCRVLLEYRMPKMGNSGVALRSPLKGNPAYAGMEIQLIGLIENQLLANEALEHLRAVESVYCGRVVHSCRPLPGGYTSPVV